MSSHRLQSLNFWEIQKKKVIRFPKFLFCGFQIYPNNDPPDFQSFQFWILLGKAILFEPKKHDYTWVLYFFYALPGFKISETEYAVLWRFLLKFFLTNDDETFKIELFFENWFCKKTRDLSVSKFALGFF